ncbi:MAG: ThiF family adenylyltransferase, partial [Candidatus Tectomicrobia bacterium]|nr:ThiF family adenylyltransferase [Candidatus Tectomicrobia bacterium]
VELGNLHRQVAHTSAEVGQPKSESARRRIAALNPEIHVQAIQESLTAVNALRLLEPYDVVLDGSDNFPTRYLVNDACVLLGKPNVYGSIFRFEGQATVFDARVGPCYRCLYPEPPPPGLVPSCAEGGVLGVLPGIVGTIQATEAIKLILGRGESLLGRLLLFDALKMRFRELKLRKDPACPACGDRPTLTHLVDYEAFCGVAAPPMAAPGSGPELAPDPIRGQALGEEWEISPLALQERLERGERPFLLDVREPQEYQICRLAGATLIPLSQLPARLHELASAEEIVVYCKTGGRSRKALELLQQSGFRRLRNLTGGINAWSLQVDPSGPRY